MYNYFLILEFHLLYLFCQVWLEEEQIPTIDYIVFQLHYSQQPESRPRKGLIPTQVRNSRYARLLTWSGLALGKSKS